MRIESRALYPYAKRFLDLVVEKHGEGKEIVVAGCYMSVAKDYNGEDVAVFYTVKKSFHLEYIEKSLKFLLGDATYPDVLVVPIMLVESREHRWKKEQADLIKVIKKALEAQGKSADDAMAEAMYAASAFGEFREGTVYGHSHIEDVSEIVERGLREYDSIAIKVSKGVPAELWDGHIDIEIVKAEKAVGS